MKKRKIAYVTATRAEYGLMFPILKKILNDHQLRLKLYYTGMHLMPEYGQTASMVQENFPDACLIDARFESDDETAVTRFMAELIKKLTIEFTRDRPDFVLTIGDRPEVLSLALVSLYLGIPSGHIHGGDKTATVDEIVRHAITKLSHFHFPATKEAARRIERMGEEKWRIQTIGAPALDVIAHQKLMTKNEVYSMLKFDINQPFILVLQHPSSETAEKAGWQMEQTMEAIKSYKLPTVVVYPNADPGNKAIIEVIEREKKNPFFRIYKNLEYTVFLSLEKHAAVWVGNSSASMIESGSFKTPVVNIGTRQAGRLHGANVLHVDHSKQSIMKAIHHALCDKRYLKKIKSMKNPWGDGKAGQRIIKTLKALPLGKKLLKKQISY